MNIAEFAMGLLVFFTGTFVGFVLFGSNAWACVATGIFFGAIYVFRRDVFDVLGKF